MSEITVDSLGFALIGLVFVGLSIPLIQRRIPPNHFYGFRTPKTLANPTIWYEVNHVAGNDFFIAGALIAASSLAMLVFAQRWDPRVVIITLLSVTLLSVAGVAFHGFKILRKM